MKICQLIPLLCIASMLFALTANAQVYKWKDKNGKIQYSDTPPLDVDAQIFGNKKPTPASNKTTEAEGTKPTQIKTLTKDFDDQNAEAKRVRQKNVEIEKKNKSLDKERAETDAKNCMAARANQQQFAQGGRVYKTDVNGDRKYMDDADLNAGVQEAQDEINKYCK